jgi:glycine/D-amino acid oxidase-like deaminating enzyme
VTQYGSSILWQETVGPRRPTPRASGSVRADVAVIGAGYTGLWAAYQLVRSDPSLRIVVLDAHEPGFGASGRNGGFAMTLLDFTLHRLATNWGDEAAAHAHLAVARSVEEIAKTIVEEGIDADLETTGLLRVATNAAQLDRIEREQQAAERLRLPGFRSLDRGQVHELVRSPTYLGGLLEDACALVNPAKLAVGLAEVVQAAGVHVHGGSPVVDLAAANGGIELRTPAATVHAATAVLAANGWTHRVPGFQRRSLPLYTYIVATEPLSDQQWDAIGWQGRQGIEDERNYVHYYRPTPDGRIVWGGTDAVHEYGGAIVPRRDRHERIRRRLERELLATFPQLGPVRFTHHWGGPLSVTSRFTPQFGTTAGGRLHYAFGYSGHGVAPAHTAGRVLRDLVLGRDTDDTAICFVEAADPRLPPEPLAWIGAELSRQLLQRQDRQMDAGRSAGDTDPLLLRILGTELPRLRRRGDRGRAKRRPGHRR